MMKAVEFYARASEKEKWSIREFLRMIDQDEMADDLLKIEGAFKENQGLHREPNE